MIALTTIWLLAHAWYPDACCHDQDCHPVPCNEIHYADGIYTYQGIRWTEGSVQASPDGACHACFHGKTGWGQCLFVGGIS